MTSLPEVRVHGSVEALVDRARAGDVPSFEALYREHAGQVFGVCLRIAKDRGKAEEWAQDVWVRVWERLGSFRGDSAFGTWVHRLAVNLILDRKRSELRRDARFPADGWSGWIEAAPGRSAPLGTALDLERAVERLPEGARTIFLLHDVEGYRHREIADRLGVAEGTVKAQLHRARRLLREALNR